PPRRQRRSTLLASAAALGVIGRQFGIDIAVCQIGGPCFGLHRGDRPCQRRRAGARAQDAADQSADGFAIALVFQRRRRFGLNRDRHINGFAHHASVERIPPRREPASPLLVDADAQSADPVFASADPNTPVVAYSGTAYVTGTPLQLGSSPALPNISFEIYGLAAGTAGPNFPHDARPDDIVADLLTNPRYGAGFPAINLDTGGSLADWGLYCQAAQLAMSLLLDKQQPAARWLEEIALLTGAAVVWSGNALKIIPYGDQPLSANGAAWSPNLGWRYSLGDGDFLRWGDGPQGTDSAS